MKLESVTLNVIFFSKTLAVCLIDKRKLEKKSSLAKSNQYMAIINIFRKTLCWQQRKLNCAGVMTQFDNGRIKYTCISNCSKYVIKFVNKCRICLTDLQIYNI